ncbi:MATE family efflux transporter [Muribaculum caecicola]|uniref:MATE family efflux transporter n=4 Tax=Muribaculum TaxID=1918540 RepID=A0AC61S3B9_9BACT|nr:MATE family efflux transporter [Muribaculum caecicola]THG44973.1 MATE family efflux transporter [Muribaculum caecicola]
MSTSDNPVALGTKSITQLLVQYSVPAIIASVATSLYNIVDSIFIGRGVGPMAIAGLAITFPLMNLVIAFCTLIAVGGATITSIFLGQKNIQRATDVTNNVMSLCLIHSIVFGGLTLIFLDPILYFFGATEETIPYAREFMRIILLGTPIAYVFIGLNNLMRATGYPKKAMISALLSVAVNVVLAPLFIFVFDWGIGGAAFATVCGQFTAFVWVLHHFLSKSSYIHLKFNARWITRSIISRIYSIGMSPFLMNVCACIVVIFINRALLNYGGAEANLAVGAYGIVNRTTMFFVMIVFGVTQGMQPILGYNYGASMWPRVKRTLNIGIWAGVAITFIGFVLTESFPDTISAMFTSDEILIRLARNGFRIYFICYPLVGCQIVIQNFFQSIGKPRLSIFLSLTRQLIFLIPMLVLLPRYYGVDGVWASMAASDMLSFFLAIITLWVMMKRLNRHFDNATPLQTKASQQ